MVVEIIFLGSIIFLRFILMKHNHTQITWAHKSITSPKYSLVLYIHLNIGVGSTWVMYIYVSIYIRYITWISTWKADSAPVPLYCPLPCCLSQHLRYFLLVCAGLFVLLTFRSSALAHRTPAATHASSICFCSKSGPCGSMCAEAASGKCMTERKKGADWSLTGSQKRCLKWVPFFSLPLIVWWCYVRIMDEFQSEKQLKWFSEQQDYVHVFCAN